MKRNEKNTFEKNIVHLMDKGFSVKLILDTKSGKSEISSVSGFIKGHYADFIHVVRDSTSQEFKEHGVRLVGIDVPTSRIVSITSYAMKESM